MQSNPDGMSQIHIIQAGASDGAPHNSVPDVDRVAA